MARLIDADELKESIRKALGIKSLTYLTTAVRVIVNQIDAAPTIDAEPVVHGRWQWLSSTYDRTPCEMRYMCDKCHHETITHGQEQWEKYCPHCGAQMDGGEDDAEQ